jgi:hypothetical protein
MKRTSTGKQIVLGIALLVLLALVILPLIPVVNKDPGFPRQPRVMAAIIVAIQAYYNDFGSFPQGSSGDILNTLQGENARKIMYLDPSEDVAQDDWQMPYRVIIDESTITVASAGSDRQWNTDDDAKREKIIEPAARPYGSPAAGSPSGQP